MTNFETLIFRRFVDSRSTLLLSLIPQDNQRFTETSTFFRLSNSEIERFADQERSTFKLSTLWPSCISHRQVFLFSILKKVCGQKNRLNFSCFRIIPFWILTTKCGFHFSVICCGFTYFSKICYLEMTTQVWALSFGCFSSIVGFGRVSSHDVFLKTCQKVCDFT